MVWQKSFPVGELKEKRSAHGPPSSFLFLIVEAGCVHGETETLDCRACKRNSRAPAGRLLSLEPTGASFWQHQIFKVEQLHFYGFYILAYLGSHFFCLQMFGCGAVAQLVLSKGTHGMFLTVNFAFGFAATLGILVCGQISGNLFHSDYGPPFIPVFQPICSWYLPRCLHACRRPPESRSHLCPVFAGERALEEVSRVFLVSDNWCLSWCCNHIWHVLW